MRSKVKGSGLMLQESILQLYRRLRLDGYRKLFGAVQEREGSLSAIEAFSADLINLLGEPTLSQFAEYVGISQPNATYKVNALAGKGYVETVSYTHLVRSQRAGSARRDASEPCLQRGHGRNV